jgi:hypothetical protein
VRQETNRRDAGHWLLLLLAIVFFVETFFFFTAVLQPAISYLSELVRR